MKEEFEAYCKKVDLSEIQITRVDNIIQEYSKILNEPILDIFVNEQLTSEGTRIYLTLWLFTESFCAEAKNFLSVDDFDIAAYKKRVKYFSINKSEFIFGQAPTKKSNMSITASLTDLLICQLRASGDNCLALVEIYNKFFLPNLIK